MGAIYSHLSSNVDRTNFCISFRKPDTLTVIDATSSILEIIKQTICNRYPKGLQSEEDHYGARNFKLHGYPFAENSSKENSFSGKTLACYILQDLLVAGYYLTLSSNLSRNEDLSTWFFDQATTPPDYINKVCCISMSNTDMFQFINFPQELLKPLCSEFNKFWPRGIQSDLEQILDGHQIKLHGNPWKSSGEETMEARRLILSIIRTMAQNRWVLYASSSLKSTVDAMFFRYNSHFDFSADQIQNSFMLSLNKEDRIRLVDAPKDIQETVSNLIVTKWPHGLQHRENFGGGVDLKMGKYPWSSSGDIAVTSREFVTEVIQSLRSQGWYPFQTILMVRKLTAKSVFVFVKDYPSEIPHFCLSFHKKDLIRFVKTPKDVYDKLRSLIYNEYTIGVSNECTTLGYPEIELKGTPWELQFSGNQPNHGLHLVMSMIKLLGTLGWRPVCSADLSAKYYADRYQQFPTSIHSIWFAKLQVGSHGVAPPLFSEEQLYPRLPTDQPPAYDDIAGAHGGY